MRFADDVNSAEAAVPHAEDYRSPDRLAVAKGTVDASDEGDRDADGYNEEEGCYVLRAAAEGVALTMHGKATPRVNPAFKIKGWPGKVPASITMQGKAVTPGKGMSASLREGTLVLQVLATVNEDASFLIEPGSP
jgi:hypothetical protein